MDSLTFIIPTYNDEATIETVIENTLYVGRHLRLPFNILVVDDASRDRTGNILKKLHRHHTELKIITHTKNAGYGKTIKELYEKAKNTWLFSLPGDYQIEPAELHKLWPYRREADMIIGRRISRADNRTRRRQSGIYNRLLRTLYGLKVHDVNSVRLMKTSILKSFQLRTSSAFVDAELAISAARAGFQVTEIPIKHRARAGVGASGGKLTVMLPTIIDMIKFRLSFLFLISNADFISSGKPEKDLGDRFP